MKMSVCFMPSVFGHQASGSTYCVLCSFKVTTIDADLSKLSSSVQTFYEKEKNLKESWLPAFWKKDPKHTRD